MLVLVLTRLMSGYWAVIVTSEIAGGSCDIPGQIKTNRAWHKMYELIA